MSCKALTMTAIAAAIALAFAAPAIAGMSKPDYQSSKKDIESAYEAAKASCGPLKANAKDVCVAEAKGKEKVARAELEVSYQPTVKTRYDARIAKAEAQTQQSAPQFAPLDMGEADNRPLRYGANFRAARNHKEQAGTRENLLALRV